MKTEDYINKIEDSFDELFQELYWEGGWDSREVRRFVQNSAYSDKQILVDFDDWDEDVLYQCYIDCEKGLS